MRRVPLESPRHMTSRTILQPGDPPGTPRQRATTPPVLCGSLLASWSCPTFGPRAHLRRGANPVRVLIQTDRGDIELELDADKAPITTANFLRYVEGKYYDGGRFHRTVKPDNQPDNKVKIEVVQAGINHDRLKEEF